MAITTAQIQQLYVAYLGRAADKAGLDYWSQQLNAEKPVLTLENLRANFVNEQAEYKDAYAGLSRQDTVIKIYNNLFGRAPDAAGLTYWTTGAGSTVQADQLLTAFITGAASTDAQVVTNKVLVAEVYTSTAGDSYAKADAASIISTVTSLPASVGVALGHLSDGTLPGVAVPAGVAAVKAEAIALKALDDLKTGQITALTDLNKAVIALNDKLPDAKQLDDADLAIVKVGTTATYDEAHVAAGHALDVRNAVSTDSLATLQANVTNTTNALASARDAFTLTKTTGTTSNVDLAVAYEKAFTANAAVKAADTKAVGIAEGKVDVDFTTASSADSAALTKANTAAGLTGSAAVTDAVSLYKALTDGTKTADQIKAVSDAFGTFLGTNGANDYSALKALAATDYTKNVAIEKLDTASGAVTEAGGGSFLTAHTNKVTADTTLSNYNAADALVKQADALDVAVEASQEAAGTAHDNLPTFAHDLTASTDVHLNTGADLFYFADGAKGTDDWTITGFNKGDALYIGEGYSLTSGVTTATDGTYVGTNASAKEVFFLQDKTTGVVSAVIETNAVGHASGGSDANVAIITLAGVTSLTDVSFANGVITSNHVAVA